MPTAPPPSAPPPTSAIVRRDRNAASATDSPAPTPAPPAAPHAAPTRASTGITAGDAVPAGDAARIAPPDGAAERAGNAAAERRAGPARRGNARRAAQAQRDEVPGGLGGRRRSQDRHVAGARDVPPRVTQQGPCARVAGPDGESREGFSRAEGVEQFRRLALILFVRRAGGHAGDALEQRFERVGGDRRFSRRCRRRKRRRLARARPAVVVVLFGHLGPDELVAVT